MSGLMNRWHRIKETLVQGGPAICNVAVTNVCNARCDFCGYARDKQRTGAGVFIGVSETCEALDAFYDRGVRYLTFSGGEPFLHPGLPDLVQYAVKKGMRPSVCTNGSRLTWDSVAGLWERGLRTLIISIDAPSVEAHESNRGLPGVCAKIREANRWASSLGVETVASVTMSKLVADPNVLAGFLKNLGFGTVTFSYPKKSTGSSSMVFSESSPLLDFDREELIGFFQSVLDLKSRFPVLNPSESIRDMIRFLQGREQRFPCFGGYKYFYLDWNMDVWRCDMWPSKMCSVGEFPETPFVRDGCTLCMSDCYRDSSVLLNFVVSLGDSAACFGRGDVTGALRAVTGGSAWLSVKALLEEWKNLKGLSGRVPASSEPGENGPASSRPARESTSRVEARMEGK